VNALLWIHALAIRVIDYLTYDLFRGRSWVKTVPPPSSAGLRPEEAERPFPGPVINQPAFADRAHGRKVHGRDFEEKRWLWAASMEAEMLVIEVEEGL
jgi:hypothetical protein